jgi:hypothetical protein
MPSPSTFVGAAFVLIGICMFVWPRRFWHVTHGRWWYDNPDDVRLPDAYLIWNGVSAASVILVGLAVFISSWPRSSD